MNRNNEQNMEQCVQNEVNKLKYPEDPNSLYSNKFYDYQVAKRKCYNQTQNIVEGFDSSWNNILKWIVIILLALVFFFLIADFLTPKKEITLNLESPSEIAFSTVPRGISKI